MNKHPVYNLACSFLCAFRGIFRSLRYERNLRIHFFAAAYVLYFTRYFDLSRAELAVVVLMMGLVIACELINTAVEATVDLNASVYSYFAKTAKDAAAGAVLASALASIVIGITLFWQPPAFARILTDVAAAPLVWFFLVASTLFIIAWPEYRQAEKGTGKAKNFHIRRKNEH